MKFVFYKILNCNPRERFARERGRDHKFIPEGVLSQKGFPISPDNQTNSIYVGTDYFSPILPKKNIDEMIDNIRTGEKDDKTKYKEYNINEENIYATPNQKDE